MRKLSDEGLQVLAPLLRGMNVSEEVSQCIREELVTKVMKCDKLIQDISPAIHIFIIIISSRILFSPQKLHFDQHLSAVDYFFIYNVYQYINWQCPYLFSSKMNKFHGIDIHSLVEVIKLHILYIKKLTNRSSR